MIIQSEPFYKKLIQNMEKKYPSSSKDSLKKGASPFIMTLPLSVLRGIQKTVQSIYQWSLHRPAVKTDPALSQIPVPHFSVLMTYDFHLTHENKLKLIEINTNGSGFLVTDLIQKTHNLQTDALNQLKQSFFNEWQIFYSSDSRGRHTDKKFPDSQDNKKSNPYSRQKTPQSPNRPEHTAIIDENIQHQKMNYEFFMYHDLMKTWGWSNEVLDAVEVKLHSNGKLMTPDKKQINFVYNRLTDFYLEKFEPIRQSYQKQQTCWTPNPRQYARLGDKKNLCFLTHILYSTPTQVNDACFLKQILPKTYLLEPSSDQLVDFSILGSRDPKHSILSKESAWKNKKTLFFKPLQSYGGKWAYRGSSITKKKMTELKHSLAQEYIPPQKWQDPLSRELWKFDIRAYVYKDQVQLVGIRFYQGQVTGFSQPLSGFGCILFQ